MTRIYTAIHIDQSVHELFDFVTTPDNWPQWHPSSLGVTGATDHPLAVGEQVTEEYRVAGRQGKVVWTVVERDAPHRWVIDGKIVGRNTGGTVVYTLHQNGGGTLFQREFTYPTPTPYLAVLDRLLVRRRVQHESEQAVRQLKALRETGTNQRAQDANSYYFLDEWFVPTGIDEVWPYIFNATEYPRWWGMVYDKVDACNDLAGDQVGAKAAVQAHGRLPYTIRFTSEITAVTAPTMLSLKAYGDLTGSGTWRLTPVDGGTQVTFEWIVEADKPLLRLLSPLVKPMLEENHRWTMRQGEAALRRLFEAQTTRQAAVLHKV